eukprot:6981728-Ditylum_brightwellii.AAC.1
MIEESGKFANMISLANDWTIKFQEISIWTADVLRCHGGDQRLVPLVEDSEKILDKSLGVKGGLVAIEYSYPSEEHLINLPIVWLTSNSIPCNPSVLDEDNDVTIIPCWDEESEFYVAINNDLKKHNEINPIWALYFVNIEDNNILCLGIREKATSASTKSLNGWIQQFLL